MYVQYLAAMTDDNTCMSSVYSVNFQTTVTRALATEIIEV